MAINVISKIKPAGPFKIADYADIEGAPSGSGIVVNDYTALAALGAASTEIATVTNALIAGQFISRESGATVDGGTVIAHAQGGAWRWHRMFDPEIGVDPRWFGAVEGASNSGVALQKAINAAAGGVLLWPAGTFSTGQTLTIPGGTSTLVISGKPGKSVLQRHSSLGDVEIIRFENESVENYDLTIEGLTFDFTGAAATPSVYFPVRLRSATRVVIRDCLFRANTAGFVGFLDVYDVKVQNCEFTNWGPASPGSTSVARYAIWLGSSSSSPQYTERVIVDGCHFHDSRAPCLGLTSPDVLITNNIMTNVYETACFVVMNANYLNQRNIRVVNNRIKSVRVADIVANGLELTGERLIIQGNVIEDVGTFGIAAFGAQQTVISGNVLVDCVQDHDTAAQGSGYSFIQLTNSSQAVGRQTSNAVISGNVLWARNGRGWRGIRIATAFAQTDRKNDNLIIEGNVIKGFDAVEETGTSRVATEDDGDSYITFSNALEKTYTLNDSVFPRARRNIGGINTGAGDLVIGGSATLTGALTVPQDSEFLIEIVRAGSTTEATVTVKDVSDVAFDLGAPMRDPISIQSAALESAGVRDLVVRNNGRSVTTVYDPNGMPLPDFTEMSALALDDIDLTVDRIPLWDNSAGRWAYATPRYIARAERYSTGAAQDITGGLTLIGAHAQRTVTTQNTGTITVPASTFGAGDTVYIRHIGGTATISADVGMTGYGETSIGQNETGVIRFITASSYVVTNLAVARKPLLTIVGTGGPPETFTVPAKCGRALVTLTTTSHVIELDNDTTEKLPFNSHWTVELHLIQGGSGSCTVSTWRNSSGAIGTWKWAGSAPALQTDVGARDIIRLSCAKATTSGSTYTLAEYVTSV